MTFDNRQLKDAQRQAEFFAGREQRWPPTTDNRQLHDAAASCRVFSGRE